MSQVCHLLGLLALEAILLVELDPRSALLVDLAALVQRTLGSTVVERRLVAEVLALLAIVDTALGTVLEARRIAHDIDLLLLTDLTARAAVRVLGALLKRRDVLGARSRGCRRGSVGAGVAGIEVVELDARVAGCEAELGQGCGVELAVTAGAAELGGVGECLAGEGCAAELAAGVDVGDGCGLAELLGGAAGDLALLAAG